MVSGLEGYVDEAAVGWIRAGCWRRGPDWWKEVGARLVGLLSGKAFPAAFVWIKGMIPCSVQGRMWLSD